MNDILKEIVSAKETPWGVSCLLRDGTRYHATSNDVAKTGRNIYRAVLSGDLCIVESMSKDDIATYREQERAAARHEMLSEADAVIRNLSDERNAGIISDDDLERWKAWVTYRKALRELDVTATDIEWPSKPE